MAHDPLATLIKVRRSACDEAQRTLAAALSVQAEAEQTAQLIERTIADEIQAASDPAGSDAIVEAFGLWLPGARRQLEQAKRTLDMRQADTARSRAALTACKTALESVEALQKERNDAAFRARERGLQRDLEDRPRRRTTDLP